MISLIWFRSTIMSALVCTNSEPSLWVSTCASWVVIPEPSKSRTAAEIGALLGVQKMITGSFGKIGNSYTIEARMFTVESGKTEKTVSKTYKGEVDGLLTEIQIVAWELVGLQPPADLLAAAGIAPPEEATDAKPKKKGGSKWLRNTLILLLLAGGGAYAAMQAGGADLPEPPDPPTSGMFMIGGE